MDQAALVDARNHPITRLLAELAANGAEVLAAGWVQTAEHGSPYLYLVTPQAESGKADDLYRSIQSILRAQGESRIRLTDIKLLGPSDPLARDLVTVTQRMPDTHGVPLGYPGPLGETPVFGISFIYPVLPPAA